MCWILNRQPILFLVIYMFSKYMLLLIVAILLTWNSSMLYIFFRPEKDSRSREEKKKKIARLYARACVSLIVSHRERQSPPPSSLTSRTVDSIWELPGGSNSLQLNVWSGSFKNSPMVSARRMWTGGAGGGGGGGWGGQLQTWISLHSNGKVSLFVDR